MSRIGSEVWWGSVASLGVSRTAIEGALDRHAAGGDRAAIDPHSFRCGATDAERVVAYFALLPHVPRYATLMYISHVWNTADATLRRWIAEQYAALLDDGEPHLRREVEGSLGLDFFDGHAPDRTQLWSLLDGVVREPATLLGISAGVPWDLKRDAYVRAAAEPELHDDLARAIAASFCGIRGAVVPLEARDLAEMLELPDRTTWDALAKRLRPVRCRIIAIITVDTADPRWVKWIRGSHDASSFLVRVPGPEPYRGWIPGSELRDLGALIGTLEHAMFPFDPEIQHQHWGEDPSVRDDLYRIEGDLDRARAALEHGRELELWPFGLYEAVP